MSAFPSGAATSMPPQLANDHSGICEVEQPSPSVEDVPLQALGCAPETAPVLYTESNTVLAWRYDPYASQEGVVQVPATMIKIKAKKVSRRAKQRRNRAIKRKQEYLENHPDDADCVIVPCCQ